MCIRDRGAAVAEKYGIPAVATLPMDPSFARLVDEGKVEAYEVEGALDGIIDQMCIRDRRTHH